MELRSGTRLFSAVDSTEVIVVRGPAEAADLCCGGIVMAAGAPLDTGLRDTARAEATSGTQLGKRYVDAPTGLEVLCTKAGHADLTAGGRLLTVKAATPLPASD